jgi:hypothetical protein
VGHPHDAGKSTTALGCVIVHQHQGAGIMRIQQEQQLSPIADEVLALVAVVQPILTGVLYALKHDLVNAVGGYENVTLSMLSRLYKPGDGDCGICFEYAVHDAMNRRDAQVLNRVSDAMKLCKVKGTQTKSILFGAEKSGALQLIDTARNILTDNSRVLYGTRGQPAKLRSYLYMLVGAFKNRNTRNGLPYSINGLWKADLFLGCSDSDRWVGTTVKNNPAQLEGAQGLRVGIIPTRQGRTDRVRLDESKNLVICPLLHDGDFMQSFYEGWQIVQAFIASDANLPKEVMLPRPAHREVARMLRDRRDFPVVDVVEALKPFAQPELLQTNNKEVGLHTIKGEPGILTDWMVAPVALKT